MNLSECQDFTQSSIYRDGDLVLGGFFPLYKVAHDSDLHHKFFMTRPKEMKINWFNDRGYSYVLGFLFAIEEINRSPHLLPNMSLGFRLYNAYPSDVSTLKSTLDWLSEGGSPIPNYTCQKHTKSMAVTVALTSEFSMQTGALLELYRTPQVFCGSFDPLLGNKDQFSSLYQMAPSHTCLASGMVSLLVHFQWTWVSILVSDDAKGEQFLWDLRREMVVKGVCMASIEKVSMTKEMYKPDDLTFLLRIFDSSANVVIVYGLTSTSTALYFAGEYHLTTHKLWITTSQREEIGLPLSLFLNTLHGSLVFIEQCSEIHGFRDFLRTVNPSKYPEDFFLGKLWSENFNCSFPGTFCGENFECPPNASLASLPKALVDIRRKKSIVYLYNTVHLVAQALHEMIVMDGEETGSLSEAKLPGFLPSQLHQFLKHTELENSTGEHVSLQENRHEMSRYDILNYLNFPEGFELQVKVGELVSQSLRGQRLIIQEKLIEWAVGFEEAPYSVCSKSCGPGFMKILQEGQPSCCFDCILCPEREISNQTDSDQCMECPQNQYPNMERNRCLLKTETFLDYQDLLGMALACTALCFSVITAMVLWVFVKYRDSPMVKANNRTLSYVLLLSLLLCFLCSLLFIGRPNTVTCILSNISFAVIFTVAVSTVLAKTITVILAFKVLRPGRIMRQLLVSGVVNLVVPICSLIQLIICGIWLGTSPPFIDMDSSSEPRSIIIECNKGSVSAFYCVLGYLGFLALGAFSLAYLARNLPGTFNEAKFLTFSMLVFCSVWVTFLPVYHNSQGKVMVAVEIFSILASSMGLLGCIFAPKCYDSFIRSDGNTSKGLKKIEDTEHLMEQRSALHFWITINIPTATTVSIPTGREIAAYPKVSIIIECNKGSVSAFYCVLAYLTFLALGAFSLAYLARNLPDTSSEAKFLTFSLLVFCSVWVTFLPVYNSPRGMIMVAVEIFPILASSMGLLGCIFAPKVLWFNERVYSYVLGFLFAIEEINRHPHLLPNMSLGFRLYNTYPSDVSTLKSTLDWLSEGEPPIPNYTCQKHTKSMAVTVTLSSEFSMQTGALLELYRTPQIAINVWSAPKVSIPTWRGLAAYPRL
ncbi:vomeronasal type-2 receptor 116-like [Tenrec ecaudatus]|uniref:vomeronasal type-2 receptor 116-like n=1 Tax=Tenrec ecaudatus TaxID=94439 RepID=UPI003F5A914D